MREKGKGKRVDGGEGGEEGIEIVKRRQGEKGKREREKQLGDRVVPQGS